MALDGGKHYLADRIIKLMPPHTHYVEPFFGGGAVLFRKPCEGVSEVINDLNGELANFWSVLQNPLCFDDLKRLLEATPFSQGEWEHAVKAVETLAGMFPDSRIPGGIERRKRAAWFFIRYRMSRQGLGKDFATLSRNRTRRGMNEQVSSWLSAIEGLPEAHERLKRVVILNDDALKVIGQQDGPKTFFYLDPPYLHSTRVTTSDYECEMDENQHMSLLKVLEDIEGKFILSGYRSALYQIFEDSNPHWRRVEIEIDNKASSKATKETKTECLWMNF